MKRRGLSIIEILISVCILAVVSIILVKLFISSDHINLKAKELDNAVMLAIAAAESPVHDYDAYLQKYFEGNITVNGKDDYTVYYDLHRKFYKVVNYDDTIYNRMNIRFLVNENIQTVEIVFARFNGKRWNDFYKIKRDRITW